MADEAYRAVFLRVHPTGKMVLSLTTESDGKEPTTPSSWPTSSASRRSTSRSSRPTPIASASATASTRAPPTGTAAAITSATAKIRDKGTAARRVALDAPPRASPGPTAPGPPATAATRRVKTVEDIALYAHGTGALPPGVEGGLDAQTVYRD